MDPAAPDATTTPNVTPSIAHTVLSSTVGNTTFATASPALFNPPLMARGVAVASAAPTAQTPTLARIGLDTFHPTSPLPPPSPSRLDTTASITNDSTSSTIAATQIRLPNGLVSSPSVWSTLVAIPMEVLLNAVPAATPVMTA